mgnify:CR=1 FL=1
MSGFLVVIDVHVQGFADEAERDDRAAVVDVRRELHVDAARVQLGEHLRRGLRSLYTLHGDEPLLAQEAADAVRAVARAQGHAERSVFIVSGARADWSEVLAAVASPSLFAERQIVELRLPTGKPGKEGGPVIEQLARAASGGDGTLLLVHLPRLDKATRASAWFGALEKHGLVFEVPTVERAALPVWIAQRLAAQGQKVPQGEEGQHALQLFADLAEKLRSLRSLRIERIDEGVYYATLVLSSGQEIDSRASDAIALAIRAGAGVVAPAELLDSAGILLPEEADDEVQKFKEFLDHVSPEDFDTPEP